MVFITPEILIDWDSDCESDISLSVFYMHFQILILQGVMTQLGQLHCYFRKFNSDERRSIFMFFWLSDNYSTLHSHGWDNCTGLGCCEGEIFKSHSVWFALRTSWTNIDKEYHCINGSYCNIGCGKWRWFHTWNSSAYYCQLNQS